MVRSSARCRPGGDVLASSRPAGGESTCREGAVVWSMRELDVHALAGDAAVPPLAVSVSPSLTSPPTRHRGAAEVLSPPVIRG